MNIILIATPWAHMVMSDLSPTCVTFGNSPWLEASLEVRGGGGGGGRHVLGLAEPSACGLCSQLERAYRITLRSSAFVPYLSCGPFGRCPAQRCQPLDDKPVPAKGHSGRSRVSGVLDGWGWGVGKTIQSGYFRTRMPLSGVWGGTCEWSVHTRLHRFDPAQRKRQGGQ